MADDKSRGAPADFSGRVIPNPKNIKPVLDTDIKANPKDKSDPKPPHGFAYYAEPYHPKDEPVKKNIDNAPLENSSIPGPIRSFKHGTDYVPETGIAILHKGEKVIPKENNMSEHSPEEKAHFHRAMSKLHGGALHKHFGIAEDKPIPMEKKQEAANSDNPHVAAMGRMAVAMHGWSHKGSKK
jgi:hypothetical protein